MKLNRTAAGHEDRAGAQREAELLKARVKAQLLGEPERAPYIGRFLLVRQLGQGATSAVYEAHDPRTGGEVALKLLRAQGVRAVQSFKQEFRGLTHLVHENLVQLHELFADGDSWYFTMELVRGVKFSDYVRTRTDEGGHGGELRCDPERLRPALGSLLSAVHALHEAGKLHCDLKPSNVLVTEQGRVVVLDFGLLAHSARGDAGDGDAVDARDGSGSPDGTPPYMAPELDLGAAPSTASDAYAIGVMLFQALTGRLPFAGSGARLQQARAGAPAPRACELAPDVPADLDALAAGLLAGDPAQRSTIEQALAALSLRAAPARASSTPAAAITAAIDLVGRDGELAALGRAFADVRAAQPIAVLVHGRSGIGKSALAERFGCELQQRALVLRGRCHERESLPYKAFDGVVEGLAAQLRGAPRDLLAELDPREAAALLRIFPHLQRIGAPQEPHDAGATAPGASQHELRRLAFAGLKALLRALCRTRALVLIVDDLQWADLDSARLLQELLEPPDAPGLLYVGCYREDEVARSEFLRALTGGHTGGHGGSPFACERRFIALDALSLDAAAQLARVTLHGLVERPERACARIAQESGGLPLLVHELCAHFAKDALRADVGPALGELLAVRLSSLDDGEHLALSLLALAARPLGEGVLARALRAEPAMRRALRALEVQGLVHADAQGGFVIYHDRLREHVTERIASSETAELHRRLAEAYEATHSGEPEWLIEHWQAAGDRASAYRYAVAAAELAANKLAFNRAASLYASALELAPHDDPRRVALATARGDALVNAGRGAEAARAFAQAAEGAGAEAGFELRCRATQHFLRSGHTADAAQLLRALFVEVGLRYPESRADLIAQLVANRARLLLRTRRPGVMVVHGSRAARLRKRLLVLQAVFRECVVSDPLRAPLFQGLYYETALRVGDEAGVFIAMAWDCYFYSALRGLRGARAIAARLAELDRRASVLDTPYARATVELMRGTCELNMSRYPSAAEHLQRALAIFREQCLGAVFEESVSALALYAALENVGPMSLLCHDAPALVRTANERQDQLTDALLSVHAGCAMLAEDRGSEAREFLARRLSRLSGELDMQQLAVTMRLIDSLLYTGDGAGAWQAVERVWPAYLESGFDHLQFWRAFMRMRRGHAAVLVCAKAWNPALAAVAASDARKLERMKRPDADVLAAGIRGALAAQRGALDEARAHMQAAVAIATRLGTPITANAYRRQLGRVTPGAVGAALIAEADAGLRAQGIVHPERFANMYAPGFGTSSR